MPLIPASGTWFSHPVGLHASSTYVTQNPMACFYLASWSWC